MSPKRVTAPLDIYVRTSDVRGRAGEGFISPKEQEQRCRALATARSYKTGEVFTDLDVSGGKMQRPELDKAIARIRDGVSGCSVAVIPSWARASATALNTAGGAPMAPPSPMPFTPSGWAEGVSMWLISSTGTSVVVGSR